MTPRRVALTLPLVEANAQLPSSLTDDLLAQQGAAVQEAVARQLVPLREGITLSLSVLALSPSQGRALVTYVRHLAATPRRFLNPETRAFLDGFFGPS
jgi:hypothetical protein